MRQCTVTEDEVQCPRPTRNNTSPYCEKHYSRVKRHGDPSVTLHDFTPASERWKKCYAVTPGPLSTPCWIWTGRGSTRTGGYGLISDGAARHSIPAHVFVYEQEKGPIPEGCEVDHLCENKACVNPDHLEPVPNGENQLRAARSRKYKLPRDDREKQRVREGVRRIRAVWAVDERLCNRCGNLKESNFFKLCVDCRRKKHEEYERRKNRRDVSSLKHVSGDGYCGACDVVYDAYVAAHPDYVGDEAAQYMFEMHNKSFDL